MAKQTFLENKQTLLINGQWCSSLSNKYFAVENPRTGETISDVANCNVVDAQLAINSASSSQVSWGYSSPQNRANILRLSASLLLKNKDKFSSLISSEMGKSLREAESEVIYAYDYLEWFASEALRVHGRIQKSPTGTHNQYINKFPVGPCLLLTPWNFPLAMIARKVAPALAAGCTVIVKPSELTPLTAIAFAKLIEEAGLPKGVLNLLTTADSAIVVEHILQSPKMRKVSFTGSTRVGKIILATSADTMLRTSLELGGNAPFIVFEDADLNGAVKGFMHAKLRNIGQACTAANRLYVHENVLPQFINKLLREFKAISFNEQDGLGPLISRTAQQSVHLKVTSAIDEGATLILGGEVPEGLGYFYPPTILKNVHANSSLSKDEIFGPIVGIQSFSEEKEVFEKANDSPYGLASYVYTENHQRIFRIQSALNFGLVGINTGSISDASAPFGGLKQSGYGKEGGVEGIEEYLSTQYVAMPSIEN